MSRRSTNRNNRTTSLSYQSLESKQMLATLFTGGVGNDTAALTYVDDTHVNVRINNTLHENVDIADGLKINLAGNSMILVVDVGTTGTDSISIDHRINGDIGIYNTEEISVDGGDNEFQLGFIPDPLEEGTVFFDTNFGVPGITAGRMNETITFSGFHKLNSGDGNDSFTIDQTWRHSLSIQSGGGDDVFNVNSQATELVVQEVDFSILSQVSISVSNVTQLSGQTGDDQFIFRGRAEANVRGGAGFDIVDYSRSTTGSLSVNVLEVVGDYWILGNDKFIGAVGSANSVKASLADNGELNWIVSGATAKLIDPLSGATVEFKNFTEFTGNQTTHDKFWLLETSSDVRIVDADWVQVSSDLDPIKGNMDGISHDVKFVNTELSVDHVADTGDFSDPVIIPSKPKFIFSGATGDGLTAHFGSSQFISGMSEGVIEFVNETNSTVNAFWHEVVVHGSVTEGDNFLIDQGWANISLNSYGGDDAFFVGSAESGLEGIGGLKIHAGAGSDRLYANNRRPGFSLTPPEAVTQTRYKLSPTGLEVNNFNQNVLPRPFESTNWIAKIGFDRDLELVRIDGTTPERTQNHFSVAPSVDTKFVVAGQTSFENSNDSLAIAGDLAASAQVIQSSINGTGAVMFNGRAKNVAFYNLNVLDGVFASTNG